MKAALIVLLACIAGSMANPTATLAEIVQTGHVLFQNVIGQLQSSLLSVVQQALGNVQSLIGSLGGRFDFNSILAPFEQLLGVAANQLLGSLLGSLPSIFGGRIFDTIGDMFTNFINEIKPAVVGLTQHALNQGLSVVLGALGSLTGSRAIGDIFASLSQTVSGIVGNAQTAIQGIVDNLLTVGQGIVDASKPHLQQLQEQLVGHGLNVLGSLSETINNLHGSITGGR